MLSRLTACCLTVLVLAPFTAPFQTCDLAAMFGASAAHHVPVTPPARAALASEGNVASVPAISHIGRVRLLQASHTLSSTVRCSSATATSSRTDARSRGLRDTASLTTILRV